MTTKLLILAALCGVAAATWSMSGYACNQPQLYSQCNCPSFCSGYMQQPQYQYQPCGYSGGCSGGGYYPRRRHHKHKKPRRKFRFDSDEDVDVPPPPPRKPKVRVHHSEEQGFIEEKRVTEAASKSDSSWENEDLWEKKFVTEPSRTRQEETKLDSEEFPEITSEEIEEAMRRKTTMAPRPIPQPAPQPAGGGLGGLGLGNGGLFGISSGVGVGVPGVGPIGVSSGLGIGK